MFSVFTLPFALSHWPSCGCKMVLDTEERQITMAGASCLDGGERSGKVQRNQQHQWSITTGTSRSITFRSNDFGII